MRSLSSSAKMIYFHRRLIFPAGGRSSSVTPNARESSCRNFGAREFNRTATSTGAVKKREPNKTAPGACGAEKLLLQDCSRNCNFSLNYKVDRGEPIAWKWILFAGLLSPISFCDSGIHNDCVALLVIARHYVVRRYIWSGFSDWMDLYLQIYRKWTGNCFLTQQNTKIFRLRRATKG